MSDRDFAHRLRIWKTRLRYPAALAGFPREIAGMGRAGCPTVAAHTESDDSWTMPIKIGMWSMFAIAIILVMVVVMLN